MYVRCHAATTSIRLYSSAFVHCILYIPSVLPARSKGRSDVVVIIHEVDVARPALIIRDEVGISRGSFIARVGGQHALNAHADALDRLDGRPASRAEEVETDDAVAVDVRVDGDGARGVGGFGLDELDFGGFCAQSIIC